MAASLPEHDVANALSSIERLTDEELSKLLSDEDYFEDFIKKLAQVQKWENDKEILIASNKSLAEYNLTFEPKLNEGKQALVELYERARRLKEELVTKQAQLESLGARTSLDTTHALLQAAAAESEEKSDSLTEQFLEGSLDSDEFIKKFVELRTEAHTRKLKAEKMGELINTQRTSRSYSTGGIGVPYPTNSGMMIPQPMP